MKEIRFSMAETLSLCNNLNKDLNELRDKIYQRSLKDNEDKPEIIAYLNKEYVKDWTNEREEIIDILLDSIGS